MSSKTKLKLEVGKRYIRRDGSISGELVKTKAYTLDYQFKDPTNKEVYKRNGKIYSDCTHDLDLVEEYVQTKQGLTVESNFISQIYEISYHRNGISGEGFFTMSFQGVTFLYEKVLIHELIATYVKDDHGLINTKSCRVIDPNNIQLKYHGDRIADEIQNLFNTVDELNNFAKNHEVFKDFTKK